MPPSATLKKFTPHLRSLIEDRLATGATTSHAKMHPLARNAKSLTEARRILTQQALELDRLIPGRNGKEQLGLVGEEQTHPDAMACQSLGVCRDVITIQADHIETLKRPAPVLSAKLSTQPAKPEAGECEAFLVVGGGPRPTGSKLTAQPAPTPQPVSAAQRQLAEHAAARERIDADKAARFSRNWGDERTARHVKLIETYMSLPLGSADRQKFFAENERELFAAQKTVLHLEATRGPAK